MRLNVQTSIFIGTEDWVEIFPQQHDRIYMSFYARTGDCYISLHAGRDDLAILIPEGSTFSLDWVTPTDKIHFKGLGSNLLVYHADNGYGVAILRYLGNNMRAPDGTHELVAYVGDSGGLAPPIFH